MKGAPANYLGRLVSKEHFRAFIYSPDGNQKLVESWDEFEACMQSGLWFATKSYAVEAEKPKARRAPRAKKTEELVEIEEVALPSDPMGFEVTDDFLPKG